ncbi:DUF317 domain-containing protein [Streptomyces longwoodensis]|uniref:DUF317 domain-containing protein n=1 Tax=Streptomyces longwoodensis TaxID=68231 RepID=UPI0033E4ED3C
MDPQPCCGGGPARLGASFGARTPVELIAAFTDALTDPAPAASTPSDPYEPLRQSAWQPPGHRG